MEINRFYLGILIGNIIIFNILFMIFIVHPETILNIYYIGVILILGYITIIINTFNAFPKKKEVNNEKGK